MSTANEIQRLTLCNKTNFNLISDLISPNPGAKKGSTSFEIPEKEEEKMAAPYFLIQFMFICGKHVQGI